MKKVLLFAATVLLTAACASESLAAHPSLVTLKDADGVAITADSTAPYSPKTTCGTCHNYDTITQGFHFQQGLDDYAADFALNNPGFVSFAQSPGMYGKW